MARIKGVFHFIITEKSIGGFGSHSSESQERVKSQKVKYVGVFVRCKSVFKNSSLGFLFSLRRERKINSCWRTLRSRLFTFKMGNG